MPDATPPDKPKEPPVVLRDVPEELVGKRILIRPFLPDDAQAIFDAIYESREHLYPWLPFATPDYNLQEAQAFARRAQARWILREDMPVGIWRREDGQYLGGTGLHRIDWTVPHFEIGLLAAPLRGGQRLYDRGRHAAVPNVFRDAGREPRGNPL